MSQWKPKLSFISPTTPISPCCGVEVTSDPSTLASICGRVTPENAAMLPCPKCLQPLVIYERVEVTYCTSVLMAKSSQEG